MFKRLISQNKFTRKRIKEITGEEAESSIVVVGNAIQRKNVEASILNGNSIAIIGSYNVGKLTSIIDICDRNNIDFFVSYDGSGFGDLPFRSKGLYVIRYYGYKPIYKKYLKTAQLVFLATENLSDSLKKTVSHFYYRKLNDFDKKEYEKLKGMSFPLRSNYDSNKESLLANTSNMIRYGIDSDKYIPESEKIVAYNFDDVNIRRVCVMANKTIDPLFKWGLMRLVKYKRPILLKYPPRLKKKDDN